MSDAEFDIPHSVLNMTVLLRIAQRIGFCLAVALALFCSEVRVEGRVIAVGSISLSVKDEIADFQPFINYLASRLKGEGIVRGEVVVVRSIGEMADRIQKGDVDLYVDSPFPIVRVARLTGARPFLRRWKRGKAAYHSLIFVRKDSGIESLANLRGRRVAFDDAFSTSGYLLPKATLIESGLALKETVELTASVHPDSVGYIFSRDDENTLFWVLKKRVAAGAIDNISFVKMAGDRAEELEILTRSIDVPRHVVAHRADLDSSLVAAIREVLVTMHREKEGREVLQDFQNTTRFDPFPQGPEGALKPVEDLMGLIAEDLER